ncbi:MAG: sigma factor-like helix-turn-helix DNA-binding protein, partial [Syntrophorhabdaceae bacterium]
FDASRGESFVKFACMCVERHLISTIKRGLRQKSSILNQSDSLDKEVYQADDSGEGITLLDFIPNDKSEIPENRLIAKEVHNVIRDRLFQKLTTMEREVTSLYLRGFSYEKISNILNINTKSVDNALSRAKDKAGEIDINDILND